MSIEPARVECWDDSVSSKAHPVAVTGCVQGKENECALEMSEFTSAEGWNLATALQHHLEVGYGSCIFLFYFQPL